MAQPDTVHQFTPRARRWDVDHAVTARDTNGREYQVRVANMSNGGFMAESDRGIAIGSVITLQVPGEADLQAEIRWAIGKRFGAMIIED